jgi:imidazoleglycerol-phosphate dehydratase
VPRAEVELGSGGASTVSTGVELLDRMLVLTARHGGFRLELGLAPQEPDEEVGAAGTEIGAAFAPLLRAEGAPGHAAATLPTDEALATVVLEASGRPLVVSNVDLASAHVGGLQGDLASRFLLSLAEAAGLTIHVRLIEGEEADHAVEAIFKALGVALGAACSRS